MPMETDKLDFNTILVTIRHWPAERQFALVHELLHQLEQTAASPSPEKSTLNEAFGLLASGALAPDDAEIERILRERRDEKYG